MRLTPWTPVFVFLSLALAVPATAVVAPTERATGLAARQRHLPELRVQQLPVPAAEITGPRAAAWSRFDAAESGAWRAAAWFDRRTGRPSLVELSQPWLPGPGNRLPPGATAAAGDPAAVLAALQVRARRFAAEQADLLGVDPGDLVFDPVASQPALPYGRDDDSGGYRLWHLVFRWAPHGVAVEGARLVFRLNQGNLVQVDMEGIADRDLVPAEPAAGWPVSVGAARQRLGVAIGGFGLGDRFSLDGELRILPVATPAPPRSPFAADRGAGGLGYRAAWVFRFHRPDDPGSWEGAVDARSGEVLYFADVRLADYVRGMVRVNGESQPVQRPFPYADYKQGPVEYADGQGYFFYPGTKTSHLMGKTVGVTDRCFSGNETITLTAEDLDFGGSTAPGTDCDNPGGPGGPANTTAARSVYYHMARAKQLAKGYLPANGYLSSTRTMGRTNITFFCNAYYDPGDDQTNFYKATYPQFGATCNNGGETEGLVLHEMGHGIDFHDGIVPGNERGSSEAYGDIVSTFITRDSCMGRGWNPRFPDGTSTCGAGSHHCTSCDGARDIDWRTHVEHVPHTPLTSMSCPEVESVFTGPCMRESHCESAPATEAIWDLVLELEARGMADWQAWGKTQELFFGASPSTGTMYSCTNGLKGGAAGGSLYHTLRAADDCDGNTANGTPHAAAIFAALDLHGIAAGSASDPANQDDLTVPVASFTDGCASAVCSFDASASTPASGITSYTWSFGDSTGGSGRTVSHTYLATGSYTVKLTVRDACGQSSTTTRQVSVVSPAVVMGEVGRVDLNARDPKTVTLSRTYQDPVVIAQPLSEYSWLVPSTARVSNVSANGFTVRIDKQYNLANPQYQWETVYYVVLERGLWKVQGSGARLEVGKLATAASVGLRFFDQWAPVGFSGSFPQAPVILTQTQTANDGSFVATRQRNPAVGGFEVAMEPFESATSAHGSETVGWVAITPGVSTWSGRNYRAARNLVADSTWRTNPYVYPCTSGWYHPQLFTSLGSFNERHAHLRHRNLTYVNCRVDLLAEEDTTWDAETSHVFEEVDLLLIENPGTLKAEPLAP